jgi:putative DNA primase/helicase
MQWVWPGRLAVGALTNVVGLPDQGKTLLYCDLIARLSIGAPMPPEPRIADTAERRAALILTLEDSLSHTIVPRLLKAGADLGHIDFVQMVMDADGTSSPLTLAADLDVLADALERKRYAMVVIDGITGYLGDTKTHNDGEVRQVLAPFAELLARMKVAGLSVMHPPKTVTNLAYFAGASVAFTTVPRVALGVAPDPDDDSANPRRLLMKIKGNLYGPVSSLAYKIAADGPAAVPWLDWEPDAVTVDVAEALDPPKEKPEDRAPRRECEAWLRSYLADGPRDAADVEQAAKTAGFKPRTIDRAKARVADSVKQGLGGWVWLLKK